MMLLSRQINALVFAFFSLSCAAQTQNTVKVREVQPKVVAGVLDILSPTLSKVLEPIPPEAAKLAFKRYVSAMEQMNASQDDAAITIFQTLIDDFPSLKEPYKYIAILYARKGEFNKSRAALSLMMRTHLEDSESNVLMGDVYAEMARLSYRTANLFDPGNESVELKYQKVLTITGQLGKANTGDTIKIK